MSRFKTASIILSSTQNTSQQPHVVTKRFPQAYTSVKDRLALVSLTMPHSFFNVTDAFINTGGCSYRWVDNVVYPVVYPAGSYTVEDLSLFLQNTMELNGHYLVTADGVKEFYLSFTTNPIYYAITLTCTPVPTSLQTYTNPNAVLLNGKVPQLIVSADNNWGNLIGFASGSYPPTLATVAQQYNSTKPPIISPTTVINIACDWIFENRFDNNASVIGSFVPAQGFGETMSYTPTNLVFLPVTQNQWSEVSISFFDQNFAPLALVDRSQIQISLALETST